MNYHEIAAGKKPYLTPLVKEIRKQLYGSSNNVALFEDGLVINFGIKTEKRYVVKIQIVK